MVIDIFVQDWLWALCWISMKGRRTVITWEDMSMYSKKNWPHFASPVQVQERRKVADLCIIQFLPFIISHSTKFPIPIPSHLSIMSFHLSEVVFIYYGLRSPHPPHSLRVSSLSSAEQTEIKNSFREMGKSLSSTEWASSCTRILTRIIHVTFLFVVLSKQICVLKVIKHGERESIQTNRESRHCRGSVVVQVLQQIVQPTVCLRIQYCV